MDFLKDHELVRARFLDSLHRGLTQARTLQQAVTPYELTDASAKERDLWLRDVKQHREIETQYLRPGIAPRLSR